jgi:hypothetical protein
MSTPQARKSALEAFEADQARLERKAELLGLVAQIAWAICWALLAVAGSVASIILLGHVLIGGWPW